jgi:hypothetical protein
VLLCPVAVFVQALIHGLNRHYYSIGINYRYAINQKGLHLGLHLGAGVARGGGGLASRFSRIMSITARGLLGLA